MKVFMTPPLGLSISVLHFGGGQTFYADANGNFIVSGDISAQLLTLGWTLARSVYR